VICQGKIMTHDEPQDQRCHQRIFLRRDEIKPQYSDTGKRVFLETEGVTTSKELTVVDMWIP